MDWWGGRVSLGNLDLAGAVNKLQESVKNIEKNFDTALGFEERPDSSSQGSLFNLIDYRSILIGMSGKLQNSCSLIVDWGGLCCLGTLN